MFFLAGPPQHNSPDTELFSCPAVQLHFLALGTGLPLLLGFFLFLAPRLNDGTSFIFILIEKAILVKFPFYLRKCIFYTLQLSQTAFSYFAPYFETTEHTIAKCFFSPWESPEVSLRLL